MSLLLDALKKAAEQKAAKSRQDAPTEILSDETLIVPAEEDTSALESSARNSLQQSQRDNEDETELDASEIQTQLEQHRVERKESEDTELGIPDSTQTQSPALSAQIQTGEDETIIFAADDVSDFLKEPELVSRESQDETDLSQLASEATDLSQTALQQDSAGSVDDLSNEDDTDISRPLQPGERTDIPAPTDAGDETDISLHQVQADSTGQQVEPTSADETDAGQSNDAEVSEATADDDMSLLLVDRDDTNLTSRTSPTNSQTPQNHTQVIDSADSNLDDLALVDVTQHQIPSDVTETAAATQTNATTGISSATQTSQGTTTRIDSTSTQTYAPDNYDRTLMKLPSDDVSKLFAGMKSDTDVVMTPDYAKKVFRSKSSAQRMQVYKVYSGIAVVILLSLGIYGAFEFQDRLSIVSVPDLEPAQTANLKTLSTRWRRDVSGCGV